MLHNGQTQTGVVWQLWFATLPFVLRAGGFGFGCSIPGRGVFLSTAWRFLGVEILIKGSRDD